MEQTLFAEWLDRTFYAFDAAILGFYHSLAEWGGGFFTPFMKFISILGEEGILLVLFALTLMLFAKTRKNGICMLGALCFGVLFTNIILKNAICRMRPFESYAEFAEFWNFVGATHAGGFSFPSGHTTAAAAAMTALMLTFRKKAVIPAVAFVALMAASRNYLMVHYPTDVIAAMLVGAVAALCSYAVTHAVFGLCRHYENMKFFHFVLHFDIKNAILKLKKSS